MGRQALRVIVDSSPCGGALDAQMLELDIAVRAKTESELLSELSHAILMEYQIAKQYGRTPFVHLAQKTPAEFSAQWDDEGATDMGSLDIPEEVSLALAAVLHSPVPGFTITERKTAA